MSTPFVQVEIPNDVESFFENAPCGYIFTSPDGLIIKANNTFLGWIDRSHSEVVSKRRFQELLTIGGKIYYETNFAPLLRMQGFIKEVTLDLARNDGRVVSVIINSEEFQDQFGNPLYIRSTLFNISDRRKYERELLRERKRAEYSEQRFKFLAKSGEALRRSFDYTASFKKVATAATHDFCDGCTIDLIQDGRLVRVAEDHRVSGKSIPMLTLSAVNSLSESLFITDCDLDSTETPQNHAQSLKPFLGELAPDSIILAPIQHERETIGAIGFYITEMSRKFYREDLELSEDIASRCAMAMESALLHQEKERAHNALKETLVELQEERLVREKFVATLTHDLRSPITAVKMSAQLILRRTDALESVQMQAVRIVNSVNRADQMIQDLLDANRIRAGEVIPLKMSHCDLGVEIREMVNDLTTIHGERFILNAPDHLEGIWNCSSLRRIVENLCNNAVKYGAERAPVTVTLKTDQDEVAISVHNEGNPISALDQATLFDPYRRTASALRSGQKGWGLGLTLVRGVTEAHQGRVTVESSLEHGTTFSLYFPLHLKM